MKQERMVEEWLFIRNDEFGWFIAFLKLRVALLSPDMEIVCSFLISPVSKLAFRTV